MLFKLDWISNKFRPVILELLDHVLSAVLFAPAVIIYWRTTWTLSGFYLFPNNFDASMLTSLFIGFFGQLIFTYIQDFLAENLHPSKNRFIYYILSRIYTYIFGAVCINLWRGIWIALEMFSGQDIVKVLVPTVISFVFLIASRILRNVSSSPLVVALDSPKGYFAVPTMFKLTGSKLDSLFILDSLFSVFVVGCLVVFAWRGVWCLFDMYLYPGDEVYSSLISVILGYVIVLVVFGLQKPMQKCCEKLTGIGRLAVLDLYIFISFVGTINVWRGIWNLVNIYFIPESPELSCWITHFGCFAFLVVMNCSNSVLVRGVAVDGEEEGGKCVVFPTSYLRTFFSDSEKKEESEQDERTKTTNAKSDVTVSV
ncbi:UNVERIFIED_CONTAM: hypothetical protein PYX00_009717 [Menopon gallinae]|uniref:Fuseless n=1 Tax=Menopon gallinae TaxID=328185 RepID=A0AAW2HCI9_9NEOP